MKLTPEQRQAIETKHRPIYEPFVLQKDLYIGGTVSERGHVTEITGIRLEWLQPDSFCFIVEGKSHRTMINVEYGRPGSKYGASQDFNGYGFSFTITQKGEPIPQHYWTHVQLKD